MYADVMIDAVEILKSNWKDFRFHLEFREEAGRGWVGKIVGKSPVYQMSLSITTRELETIKNPKAVAEAYTDKLLELIKEKPNGLARKRIR